MAEPGGAGGLTRFDKESSAQNATIINQGGAAILAKGGRTIFNGSSDAGDATLVAEAGRTFTVDTPFGTLTFFSFGGSILFNENSAGGAARIQLFGDGSLDISPHAAPGITIGSLGGDGVALLGDNNLSVGNKNLSSVFAGSILDGG